MKLGKLFRRRSECDEAPENSGASSAGIADADVNLPNSHGFLPLQAAAIVGDIVEASRLLELGAKPDALGQDGQTALVNAIVHDKLGVAELLLTQGQANPDAVNKFRRTPLHIAAKVGDPDAALLLLKHGADAQKRDADSNTAVDIAREAKNSLTASVICEHISTNNTRFIKAMAHSAARRRQAGLVV